MKWFGNMLAKIGLVESEQVRTRDKKGRYIADDPTTAKNEAYKTVKKRKKKKECTSINVHFGLLPMVPPYA